VVGLAIGGALAAGVLIGKSSNDAGQAALDELRLKAMASHGAETFAIATGPIDDEVEGLFCLDFLTGELQCFVLNTRGRGLAGWFKTNVVKDMPVEKGKKPTYVLATGSVASRGSYGNARPAASVIYVADANSGVWAAYTFGWAKGAASAGVAQAQEMQLVFAGKARSLEIRE
jgi:hypothetical protein